MVSLPAIRGVIDRRILVNYRVDPDALAAVLPDPFDPWTVDGHGVGGICLIRLRDARPRPLPARCGLTSENAAHRIAVETDDDTRGVYVPRRDTSSRLNAAFGGRLFSGNYHRASFDVVEGDGRYDVRMESADGEASVSVVGTETDSIPDSSVFDSLEAASAFFREGSLGYSPDGSGRQYDGVELHTDEWAMSPLDVEAASSSFFEDPDRFPTDAVAFDGALLMRNIDHEWRSRAPICPETAP